jgi:hypothetical protein
MLVRPYALMFLGSTLLAAAAAHAQAPQVNCVPDFMALRGEAETRGKALQAAGQRKAQPAELCPLFRRFAEAEAKVVRFMEQNQAWCQIPPQATQTAKQGHARTIEMRNKICQIASAPVAPPQSPSAGLSGALGPIPFGGAPAPTPGGSGVFDTLTGNVLQR